MNKPESFFWYDLETFGLDPFYDRIAQFAGQRTDYDLNPIGEPVVLYCKLSADYIPDPGACLVTGITPQEVKQKGLPESEFIDRINRMFSVPGTCVCGFNTLKFDDEFIRNALYRNFIDPYEREWKNSCSRWDIIDLVRACHDLRPQGILWPKAKENGNPDFRLTELTSANNIDQTGAHDAMVDVNATIAVAKLIKEKQPKLFEHYLKLRSKIEVKNLLSLQSEQPKALLHTSTIFTNQRGCTSLIMPIIPRINQDNSIICFNLSQDPALLLSSTDNDLYKTPGLFKIAINKSPFLAPSTVLTEKDYERLGINLELCRQHYRTLIQNKNKITDRFKDNPGEDYDNPDDPDFGIYSKFFSDYDKRLFETIRLTPPEQRLKLNLSFEDPRCSVMLKRHVCRNYPQLLDPETLKWWKEFATSRLLCPPGNPINDIYFVERKIDEKLKDSAITDKNKETLLQLKDYLVNLKHYLGLAN